MQFETRITAAMPRCGCPACGVKTIAVPWAGKHARFTLLFEAFAVEVLTACTTVQQAAQLLSLHWETTHAIMQRAVARGLRNFDHYRTRILFFCGKLKLLPNSTHGNP